MIKNFSISFLLYGRKIGEIFSPSWEKKNKEMKDGEMASTILIG